MSLFGDLFHITFPYLLKVISPIVKWCFIGTSIPTPVFFPGRPLEGLVYGGQVSFVLCLLRGVSKSVPVRACKMWINIGLLDNTGAIMDEVGYVDSHGIVGNKGLIWDKHVTRDGDGITLCRWAWGDSLWQRFPHHEFQLISQFSVPYLGFGWILASKHTKSYGLSGFPLLRRVLTSVGGHLAKLLRSIWARMLR